MSVAQKILTFIFLVLFVMGTLIAATSAEEPLIPLISVWVVFGVVYTGLFFIFAPKKKP